MEISWKEHKTRRIIAVDYSKFETSENLVNLLHKGTVHEKEFDDEQIAFGWLTSD